MRRQPPQESTDTSQKTDHDQVVWWYDHTQRQGGIRRFSGHVNHVGGAEGERLRAELAAVIRDLLAWAAEHSRTAEHPSRIESTEDGEAA